MQQSSSGLGILVAGLILTRSAFPERADPATVTEAMLDSLMIHYIPAPLALWTIRAMFLWFYPIDEARHERNVRTLRDRQAQVEAVERDALLHAPAP